MDVIKIAELLLTDESVSPVGKFLAVFIVGVPVFVYLCSKFDELKKNSLFDGKKKLKKLSAIMEDKHTSNAVKKNLACEYENESFRCATGARLTKFDRERFSVVVESEKHLFSWKSVELAKEYLTDEMEPKMGVTKLRRYWHISLKCFSAFCGLLGMLLLFLFSVLWKHYVESGEWVSICFSIVVCLTAAFTVLYSERGYMIAQRIAGTVKVKNCCE